MKQFVPLLKKINEKLDLPQPIKSKIILEMAADLSDLYETYCAKGLVAEEAKVKAEEMLDASEETLAELAKVHTTGFRKFLDRISMRTQVTWEKIMLVLIIIVIAVSSGKAILMNSFFHNGSNFIWPILFSLFGIIVLTITKYYQLYIKKDHRPKKLQSGMNLILYIGILNIIIGALGYTFEMLVSGGKGSMFIAYFLIIIDTRSPEAFQLLIEITNALVKSSSIMMICILATITTALLWFGLMSKILKIEQAEAEFSLED